MKNYKHKIGDLATQFGRVVGDADLEEPLEEAYRRGVEDGLRAFAYMKSGVSYVGSCGTTLKEALELLKKSGLHL
jgi:hypothetical protein